MSYKLQVNVFLGGKEVPAGSVVEIADTELAEKLLARGSIVHSDGSETPEPTVAAVEAPAEEAPLEQATPTQEPEQQPVVELEPQPQQPKEPSPSSPAPLPEEVAKAAELENGNVNINIQ